MKKHCEITGIIMRNPTTPSQSDDAEKIAELEAERDYWKNKAREALYITEAVVKITKGDAERERSAELVEAIEGAVFYMTDSGYGKMETCEPEFQMFRSLQKALEKYKSTDKKETDK